MSDDASAYREAGVDIEVQETALGRIGSLVRSTATPGVMSELGGFGGLFRLGHDLEDPVLVASADGVGTKLMVAQLVGDFTTVGRDLVNHCVNDILVQGAKPLFFLDYVGAGVLEPGHFVGLVEGVAAGCRENGCALLGGETAEMPGFYQPGDYELVGFVVGVVERSRLLGPMRVVAGNVLIGLPSAGLHTNGYSLARHLVFDTLGLGVDDPFPGMDASVGEVLLAPHLSYLSVLENLLADDGLRALAHITGGGLTDNLPRALADGLHAVVDSGAWETPAVFEVLAREGDVPIGEMRRVFNMGIGMVLVVAAEAAERIVAQLEVSEAEPIVIGRVAEGGGPVVYS